MPAYFAIAFWSYDEPFNPAAAGAAGTLAGTAHRQDRDLRASAVES